VYGTRFSQNHGCNPDITIAILTYRRPQTLQFAIESALSQKFNGTFEIIVCDDSGEKIEHWKETDQLMKNLCSVHPNLIYFRHKQNLGEQGNWNRAIELCESQHAAFLHDDGILDPFYLKTISNCLKLPIMSNYGAIGIMAKTDGAKSSLFNDFGKKIFQKIK
jgi:glycosyltransferase involved in cell wall biosynthesis